MTLTSFPGGHGEMDEPEWALLIPDSEEGSNERWRIYAHREWLRAITAMREAGTLATENRHQIQRLVLAYVRFDRASAQLFASSLVLISGTGSPMLNQWQVEMRAADSDATTAEMELGIPPRRRGAVTKATRKEKRVSAADSYLGKSQAR
jgi:hypothetical protein